MKNLVPKPANEHEIALYGLMGEALCTIQELEAALSHSITLKKHSTVTKKEADKFLNEQLSYTLGKAVKLAGKEQLYPSLLQTELNSFYQRRNWLVHKAMLENRDDLSTPLNRKKLFQKIKTISEDAQKLQYELELNLIDFCASKGRDMPHIRALIKEHYN